MSKANMLQLLEQTNFPDFNRKDVLRKGQKHYKGMVLGKVRKMYSSCDGKMCKVESRHNKRYPEVLKAARALIRAHNPSFRYEAITINKNNAAARHRDKTNKANASYIIGLGNYTGGELVFTEKDSPQYGSHNIRNKWLKFDGKYEHYVKPFKGTRYTIVYYSWV